MRGRAARTRAVLGATVLLAMWLAWGAGSATATADPPRPGQGRPPYGLQRPQVAAPAPAPAPRAAPATPIVWAIGLATLLGLAALIARRRRRTPDGTSARAPASAPPPRPLDERTRIDLEAARSELEHAPRAAATRAVHALREYGTQFWIVDLIALTTPEVEIALGEIDTPVTTREFVRLLGRYDAERFQRAAADGPDTVAMRACIDASLRFVDDTAARLRR